MKIGNSSPKNIGADKAPPAPQPAASKAAANTPPKSAAHLKNLPQTGVPKQSVPAQGAKSPHSPMPGSKSSATQSTSLTNVPADKNQSRPTSADTGSAKTELAKAAQPGRTVPTPQTSRTAGTKGTRKDSHTDHPVANPHHDERGGGGKGGGGHNGGNGHHREDGESMHGWMPPSGMLAPKMLRRSPSTISSASLKSESSYGRNSSFSEKSGLVAEERLSAASTKLTIQSAFQSSLSKLAAMLFKPDTVAEETKSRRIREQDARHDTLTDTSEKNAMKASAAKQANQARGTYTEKVVRNPIATKSGTVLNQHQDASDQMLSGAAPMKDNTEPRLSQRLSLALVG
jgi:hypothetical protein